MLDAAREHEMTVEPLPAWRHLREGHADLKSDARLFREHADRPDGLNGGDDGIEELAHGRRFIGKVRVEGVWPARVCLIAIRELAAAFGTFPHRWPGAAQRLCQILGVTVLRRPDTAVVEDIP